MTMLLSNQNTNESKLNYCCSIGTRWSNVLLTEQRSGCLDQQFSEAGPRRKVSLSFQSCILNKYNRQCSDTFGLQVRLFAHISSCRLCLSYRSIPTWSQRERCALGIVGLFPTLLSKGTCEYRLTDILLFYINISHCETSVWKCVIFYFVVYASDWLFQWTLFCTQCLKWRRDDALKADIADLQ